MKNWLIVLLFISVFAGAQNQRIAYEYTFVKDSLHHENSEKEMMFLDITPKASRFYSAMNAKADSIMAERRKNPHNRDFSGITFGKVEDVVTKEYPEMKTFLIAKIGSTLDAYKVQDERKPVWKISSEKSTIENYPVQKATTFLFGRKWTAWFTNEIPISDGPYKFYGLPGLILKLEDATKSHIFELKGIQKLPDDFRFPDEKANSFYTQMRPLDRSKFKKLFTETRENPTKDLRQQLAGGARIVIQDEKGNPMDVEEYLRNQERNAKEENKKDNNLLELDLLK